ncbi:hypothetical protein FIBSPDRAFT_832205 [Athelia psychrophila]|uniref:BTB domain-containing protein n=1 Tax=Athelia psychrophila TaxID=1759441 RepID=A0A166ETW3_9AGAM|nr:hypothetical protein FIBSPDRAFT_805431 [Fibularhizoctonia sp. CBS 109695]KZP16104.1 hypothetical protein FIBSPDRAFT_832205 [Fibularhizoctonia sp. CBS 109695]
MEGQAPADRVSERFCKVDSDITFKSCDEILFKVHCANLKSSSEGFSPPEGTTAETEVVSLTENGATLELLFQHMYPQRQPDLRKFEFKQLEDLAEAAEKYQVYTAMEICHARMEEALPRHPFEVMMYAMRHGYADLMDKSELKTLEVSPTTAFESFKPEVYIAWTRYYAQWLDLLASFHDMIATTPADQRHSHNDYSGLWFMRVSGSISRPAALLKLESICEAATRECYGNQCVSCKSRVDTWRNGELRQGMECMKKLRSFL